MSLLSQSDGLPALVTLKKGLVALARQWMKFIVVTPAFKGIGYRPAQSLKPQSAVDHEHEEMGLGWTMEVVFKVIPVLMEQNLNLMQVIL